METFVGIGDRLKEERERLGLNQTDFAALAGASKNTQYNYEKGERSPDANYLAAAASQGVDVLYVLTGERKAQGEGSLSTDEAKLVERYRLMSSEGQATINSVSEALATFHK
ncbi:Cro/Cl family transcriptional regulator [Pseudomonas putida H8234]|nr:Cro/Cl family transcriptional regulator [Pseudomonas putida H8234]